MDQSELKANTCNTCEQGMIEKVAQIFVTNHRA